MPGKETGTPTGNALVGAPSHRDRRAYMVEYRKRAEVRERERERELVRAPKRQADPKWCAYQVEYRNRPEVKERQRAYYSPEQKKARREARREKRKQAQAAQKALRRQRAREHALQVYYRDRERVLQQMRERADWKLIEGIDDPETQAAFLAWRELNREIARVVGRGRPRKEPPAPGSVS